MRDPEDARTLDLFDGQVRTGAAGIVNVELCCPACAGVDVVVTSHCYRCQDCGQLMMCPAERVPK